MFALVAILRIGRSCKMYTVIGVDEKIYGTYSMEEQAIMECREMALEYPGKGIAVENLNILDDDGNGKIIYSCIFAESNDNKHWK
jgi:hypothetical protein